MWKGIIVSMFSHGGPLHTHSKSRCGSLWILYLKMLRPEPLQIWNWPPTPRFRNISICQVEFSHCGFTFGLKKVSDFGFLGLGFSAHVTAILNEHFYWVKMADTSQNNRESVNLRVALKIIFIPAYNRIITIEIKIWMKYSRKFPWLFPASTSSAHTPCLLL